MTTTAAVRFVKSCESYPLVDDIELDRKRLGKEKEDDDGEAQCETYDEEGGSYGGAEDVEDDVFVDDVEIIKVKVSKNVQKPSKGETEAHNATHVPNREWCEHCVRGKAKDKQYRCGDGGRSNVPTISLDYCFLGSVGADAFGDALFW